MDRSRPAGRQAVLLRGGVGTTALEALQPYIIIVNDEHKDDCLQISRGSRNIAPSLAHPPIPAQRTIAMTIHLINAAVLSVVTVFLVNRAFALYDLVNAATVSEHI
jgi:hypothetical protein